MSRLKKFSLSVVAVLAVVVVAGGYLAAYSARPRIERQVRAYVVAHKISGFDLSGHVPPDQIKVYSEVSYPFVVVGSYEVPRDLHASYYQTRYLVLPWGFYALSSDEFHLI